MLYAAFMFAILIVLGAMWRGLSASVPMFVLTLAAAVAYLVGDMTSPLILRF